MKNVYRVLAYSITAMVFFQAAAIAFGVFTVDNQVENGAVFSSDSATNLGQNLHGIGGTLVIPILALLFLIASFFVRVPGTVKWAALVLALVALQITLAFLAFSVPALGALHGMNALAILATSTSAYAGRRVSRTAPHDVSGAQTPAERAETRSRARLLGRRRSSV